MTGLTEKGRTAAHAGVVAAEAVERQMLSNPTDDETEVLRDLLQRCADVLEGMRCLRPIGIFGVHMLTGICLSRA